jgi:hypothetical protein
LNLKGKAFAASRRGRAPESTRQILGSLIWSWGLGPKFVEQMAARLWSEAVGREDAVHSRVNGMRDGVLVVAADSASAAQSLGLRKVELLARLRELLAREVGRAKTDQVLRDVRFVSRGWARLGRPCGGGTAAGAQDSNEQGADAPCISAEEAARLEGLLSEVGNEEVRDLLRRGLTGLISASRGKEAKAGKKVG